MTPPSFPDGSAADVDALLPLVRQFYAHFGYPYSEALKRRALSELLSNPALGRLVLVRVDGAVVGYAVVAFSFSLEYEGRTAFLDELFVEPSARARGLGSAVVGHVAELCRSAGVNALNLETEDSNTGATRLYERLGFRSYGRHLMTKLLASVPGPKA